MPRILTELDRAILKKVAPESSGTICTGFGGPCRSILPPLANHYATDGQDFARRLERLDDDDLRYLLGLIRDGSESLGCVPVEYLELFLVFTADRLGRETALLLLQHLEDEGGCTG
ncbi:MAG TPA: hypothetical protein HA263_09780 [Methanoregulaceae archaeon]|nr:hypothetical protein [Methanoculleus sp.]MDK2989732.1 hypothetical protein [Methanoculleus sp.]HIH04107.1 hypothetical protein [Methanoregulaceae archaeon]